jgi:hypothetical protein
MTEDEFWIIIDGSNLERHTGLDLQCILSRLDDSEIVSFENILHMLIARAGIFRLLAACFVIESYVSDDSFKNFRAWLVSKGKSKYAAAIDDTESIADWLEVDEIEDIDGSEILSAAQGAFATYGPVEEFYGRILRLNDPVIQQDWPESKEEYKSLYPRIVEKFWDQERINELHAD